MPAFSERLRQRHRLWWEFRAQWWSPSGIKNITDRVRQHYTLLHRNDPARRWQRGVHWQRALSNKWNAREFALRHGCRVPALYWKGRRLKNLDFSSLPEHFVLRSSMGHSRVGVYVFAGSHDLLRGKTFTAPEVKAHLRRYLWRWGCVPLLAEEFVRSEDGAYHLPADYSFHSFAGYVGLITVKSRSSGGDFVTRHYTTQWVHFPTEKTRTGDTDGLLPPPRCLGEMLSTARRLGTAYGSYVRVDLFASDRGCVFGEFAATPKRGRGFAPSFDEYLGSCWQEHCPDRI